VMSSELLVVLPVQEARNVDRLTLVARFILVDLRLGRSASDVRHTLEQGSSSSRRLLIVVLIFGRSNRRRTDRAGQNVVRAEQQLVAVFIVRDLSFRDFCRRSRHRGLSGRSRWNRAWRKSENLSRSRLRNGVGFDAGRDDRNADFAAKVVVEGRA